MKKSVFVIIDLVNAVVFYLFGAFMGMSFKLNQWDEVGRATYPLLTICAFVMQCVCGVEKIDGTEVALKR